MKLENLPKELLLISCTAVITLVSHELINADSTKSMANSISTFMNKTESGVELDEDTALFVSSSDINSYNVSIHNFGQEIRISDLDGGTLLQFYRYDKDFYETVLSCGVAREVPHETLTIKHIDISDVGKLEESAKKQWVHSLSLDKETMVFTIANEDEEVYYICYDNPIDGLVDYNDMLRILNTIDISIE